jgi:hypothetical protein
MIDEIQEMPSSGSASLMGPPFVVHISEFWKVDVVILKACGESLNNKVTLPCSSREANIYYRRIQPFGEPFQLEERGTAVAESEANRSLLLFSSFLSIDLRIFLIKRAAPWSENQRKLAAAAHAMRTAQSRKPSALPFISERRPTTALRRRNTFARFDPVSRAD